MGSGDLENLNEKSVLLATSASHDNVAEERSNTQCRTTLWDEARAFLNLAATTTVVDVSAMLPLTLSSAYVGHELGVLPFDGLSLSVVVINVTALSLLEGLVTASETLTPQAYGAGNYAELGVLVVRSFVVCMAILVPIAVVTAIFIENVLLAIGEDEAVSSLAASWYRLYLIAIPFTVAILSLWPYFTTQEQMMPLVVSSLVSGLVVLPCSLYLFVSFLGLGYLGSCVANILGQVSSLVLMLCAVRYLGEESHKPEIWPGFHVAIRETFFRIDRLVLFVKLGMAGILASTEWWYWEILCALVGTFGPVPLSAHAIATQVVILVFMIPFAVGAAITIRMGVTLSTGDVPRTRWIAVGGLIFGGCVSILLSLGVYFFRAGIFSLFTTDSEVVELCHRIWGNVALYVFQLSIYGLLQGVVMGLGNQWFLGIVTAITLWFVALPLVYYLTVIRDSPERGSVELVWRTLIPPYFAMNVIVAFHAFFVSDWNAIGAEIWKREKNDGESAEELSVPTTRHFNETSADKTT